LQQETNRKSLSTKFPTKADLPPFDQTRALTLHQIMAGDVAIDIQMHELRFVYDEAKQERIQFAIAPYSNGEILIFSPTSEMCDLNNLIIFNLAQKMKRFAKYSLKLDRFVLEVRQMEIFEEKFVTDAISFRDQKNATIIVDSSKDLLKVEYHCKCNTPGGEDRQTSYFDFWDATKQAIECSTTQCKERYHIDCLTNKSLVNPSSMDWKCPKCSLKELIGRAKHWSLGPISNTCTIDGHSSGIIFYK
jgi:hypothetical protein